MFSRTFLLALALAGALPAVAAPRYSVTALPAGTNPLGINDLGHVAGDLATPDGRRGFVWADGALTALGTLGGPDSTASAINRSGQVAGSASLANGQTQAFRATGGVPSGLNVFGSSASFGIAINDAGQVAGQYIDAANNYRAFVHADGSSTDLGTLGGNFAYAAGINSAGQVVGVSALDDTSPFLSHAFLYANGVMTDLGTLGGSYSMAEDINDAGQVVGNAWVRGSEHAFLYAGGQMTDLGTLGGRRSFASAINERGQVVGRANDPEDFAYRAFLFEDGAMVDLNTLIDADLGYTLYDAQGINESGQIIAYGCRNDACGGVLLLPVPETQTWRMLLAGLLLLGWRVRINA